MKLNIIVIQYDCEVLYQSAYIGLVKNIRNKAFSQIKYNVNKIHISKKIKGSIMDENISSKKTQMRYNVKKHLARKIKRDVMAKK